MKAAGYYEYMLRQKGILKKDAIARSYVDRIYSYQIAAGTRKPGRDKLIVLCIGAEFTFDETRSRWSKERRSVRSGALTLPA